MTLRGLLLSVLLLSGPAGAPAQRRADSPEKVPQALPAASTPPVSPRAADALRLGPGDLVEVSLYGVPDFKVDVRVSSKGEISLPMAGAVAVSGLSAEEVESRVAAKLVELKLFNDPHVTVFIKEYTSQGISVMGEVQKPGVYPLLGARTLYDAITAAGGATPKAGQYAFIASRGNAADPRRVRFSTDGSRALENNIVLDPGDTVVVSKAPLVYVVGDVRQPGGFVMENDRTITVLQALALAQGANPNAALDSAKLIRKGPGGPVEDALPLKKILSAKAPDLPLQPEDIIFVPGSLAKSALKRGAEAIVQMATGVAVWRLP